MIEWVSACFANILPALVGALVVLCALGRPARHHELGFALAAGYLLGVGAVAGLSWISTLAGWGNNPIPVALALLLVAAYARSRYLRQSARFAVASCAPQEMTRVKRCFWWGMLAILLVNGALMASEAMARPIYPWDAWSAWSVKARVWLALGTQIDFVSFDQWLASSNPQHYSNEAWHYPELIPRFQLWVVQWAGRWNEQMALTPWLFAGLALLLATYHGLRLLGSSAFASMGLVFAVGTIPILNVQLALPGLVDLWVAFELAMFALLTLLWTSRRQTRWLFLALTVLIILATTKIEGVVWTGLCLPVLFFCITNNRVRQVGGLIMVAGIVVWWFAGGLAWQVTPAIKIILTPEQISLPYLGTFNLEFSNQLGPFLTSFLALPNWHLTWYLLLPAIALAVTLNRSDPQGRGLLAFISVALGLMFILFFMTHAGMWAQSMTASNRLALHFVPASMIWAGLLLYRSITTEPVASSD